MRSLLLALFMGAFTSTLLAGEPPSYLILRAPETPAHHDGTHGYYAGRGYGVETQTYNYGWFGAKYGRKCERSFGYHRNYTQWKVK